MRTSEKVISAILTMALGVLLIVLRATFIEVLMTVAGIGVIVLGIIDLLQTMVPPAVVKIVVGGLIILCGWVLVEAVLYLVAAILLIGGILLLYDKIKRRVHCFKLWQTIVEYAIPSMLIFIGVLLLFNQGETINFIFVFSGILTVIEGGLLLVNALVEE